MKISLFSRIVAFSILLSTLLVVNEAGAELVFASGIGFVPPHHLHTGKPFPLRVQYELLFSTQKVIVTIHIPKEIHLLSGELEWKGKFEKGYVHTLEPLVEINTPGIYEATVTLDVKDLSKQKKQETFPIVSSIFFYAQSDTLLWRDTRNEVEQAIKDSLGYPEVVSRRSYDSQDSIRWTRYAQQNGPTFSSRCDLANLAYALPLYSLIFTEALSDSFDTSQVALIKRYRIVYSPPRYYWIEHRLAMDLLKRRTTEVVCSLPEEQLQILSKHISKNMTELYNLDQNILKTKSSEERMALLKEREVFLINEMKERKPLLITK